MLSLAPEIRTLHAAGALDDASAAGALALEDRRAFSVRAELLIALYGSVLVVVAGVGILVRDNLDRIGPVALIVGLLAAAAVCYAFAIRTALRGLQRSLPGDYVLLLGALLASAALGYAEHTFRWLGEGWSWHLLLLAAVHAFTAYRLDSRLVLTAALASFAGWLGVEGQTAELVLGVVRASDAGWRALLCAAVFLLAREAHRRLGSARDFDPVYEHFAANLAFWGALALALTAATRLVGIAVLLAVTGLVAFEGTRRSRESFLVYAIGYGAFGACALEAQLLDDTLVTALAALATILLAAWLLWRTRMRLRTDGA